MRIAYIQDQTITEFKGEFFHSKSIRFFSKFLSGFNETDTLEVYCPFDYANEESVVKRYQNIYNPQIHYHSIPLCKKISNYMKIKNAVTDAVSKSDLCYLRVGIAGYFASKVCKKQGKKYVAIVNEDLYQNTKVHRKIIVRLSSLPLKYMARTMISNANYACYVTKYYLQSKYPNKNKCLGCSDVEMSALDETQIIRRLSHIEKQKDTLVIGTAGAVDVRLKAQDVVIRALPILNRKTDKKVIYQLIGTGNKDRLLKLAKKMGVESQVEFMGEMKHEDVLKWMENLDIYVHPSRSEGLPRTIIEAMSRALPCICSDVGGVSELINKNWLISYKRQNPSKIPFNPTAKLLSDFLFHKLHLGISRAKL